MDAMCKDMKRVLQTVVKMESTITVLQREIEDLALHQTRMPAQLREYTCQQLAVSTNNGAEQSHVSEPLVFLPPQLQESGPSQLFQAPEMLPPRYAEPPLDTVVPLPIAIPPRNAKFAELPSAEINRAQLKVYQKCSSSTLEPYPYLLLERSAKVAPLP